MAAFAKNVMLAETWDEKTTDPKGWWISEKLDGVRAYWNGTTFYSRNGNTFEAPAWFKAKLPNATPLDGELWCGRGLFQKCVGIAKKKLRPNDNDPTTSDWRFVSYCVFDAPHVKGDFETRYNYLKTIIKSTHSPVCVLVGVEKCVGVPDLRKKLDEVEAVGGEGLMLRKPHSPYQQGRCDLLLKVKTFHDEEAKVIGYQYKEGSSTVIRHLRCILPNGIDFSIGTGFSNAERANPPKIGAVITFKYQSLSDEGKPRFPAYLRERNDITWKDVLNNSKQKQLYSNQDKIKEDLKEHGDKEKKAGLLFTKSYSSSLLLHDAPAGLFQSPVKSSAPAAKIIDAEDESASSSSKPVCKYGPSCYRKNEDHLEQYSHPWADGEASAPAPAPKPVKKSAPPAPAPVPAPVVVEASPVFDDPGDVTYMPPQPKKTKKQLAEEAAIFALNRPSCAYGAGCYRKNPQHRKDEAHPGDVDWVDPTLGPVTRSAAPAPAPAPAVPAHAPAPTPVAPKPVVHAPKAAIVDDDNEDGGEEKEESTNSDNRPICRYGSSCYRTNPDHLKKFRHYWESKPAANKSKPSAKSSSSSSSSSAAVAAVPEPAEDNMIIDDTASLEALEDDLLVDDDDLLHVSPVKPASSSSSEAATKKRPNLIVDDDDDDDNGAPYASAPPAKRPKFV